MNTFLCKGQHHSLITIVGIVTCTGEISFL